MSESDSDDSTNDDEQTLARMGYVQELLREMSGFSNLAVSLSIICILAGGITSFHLGICGVGGAAIGIGWPLLALFSLTVAATMAQVASAFPTAGGLYHWAAILGGRGWGWATGWFNTLGLVTILAAINVGTYLFCLGSLGRHIGFDPHTWHPAELFYLQLGCVAAITFSQALLNHFGIRLTSRLLDFSGYWILLVSLALTVALLVYASEYRWPRLAEFRNFSGEAGRDVWPRTENVAWLFLLGLLLPAYTITGFDASAHTAEETREAAVNVPRGIVRSVLISGLAGWVMLSAAVLAAPDLAAAASQGDRAFVSIVEAVVPGRLALPLYLAIALAQYLCGLATVTSASRMVYAFARDGGLPGSKLLCQVHAVYRTPAPAIWAVSLAAVLFTLYTPVYATITVACTLFLYVSYALPAALGFFAYGRTWTHMGPWQLGIWYRPLACVSAAGCGLLIVIGMQPPNEKAVYTLGAAVVLLLVAWRVSVGRTFKGPPGGRRGGGEEGRRGVKTWSRFLCLRFRLP